MPRNVRPGPGTKAQILIQKAADATKLNAVTAASLFTDALAQQGMGRAAAIRAVQRARKKSGQSKPRTQSTVPRQRLKTDGLDELRHHNLHLAGPQRYLSQSAAALRCGNTPAFATLGARSTYEALTTLHFKTIGLLGHC